MSTPPDVRSRLKRLSKTKRVDFRWLTREEIGGFKSLFGYLYNSQGLSTTEIARLVGKSQFFAWSMCMRLGIKLRLPDEGGRLYAPKRTPNKRRSFDGTGLDRAYLRGFGQGDLNVRRASSLAIMVSTTTTHPDFVSLFESLFRRYGPIYVYSTYDEISGYRWKVAARLDNSFSFMLPELRGSYPSYASRQEFFAWLAGIIDSDGSLGIIHAGKYVRVNVQISNQDLNLLRHIKNELIVPGYTISGPYTPHQKGHVTRNWNIKYNEDLYQLMIQGASEVKEILRSLPLRHREKRERKKLILGFEKPCVWSSIRYRVESLRNRVEKSVSSFMELARMDYQNRRAGKAIEPSPVSSPLQTS